MKKKFILFSATLGIAYLGITAYSSGPAASSLNRTGSDGATASCAGGGCHSASGTATTGAFTITDKATATVVTSSKYVPGKTYIVKLSGNSPSMTKFGFQVTVTKADKSLAGSVSTTASGTIARTVGTTKIVEHTSALSGSSGGVFVTEFEWTAPAKGTGTATFYGIINAVNGNGNTGGDEPSMGFTAAFTEDATSSIAAAGAAVSTSIYPNPCTNTLHIRQNSAVAENLNVFISDLSGRQVIYTTTQEDIDVSSLQSGTYLIRLGNGIEQQVSTFIKK